MDSSTFLYVAIFFFILGAAVVAIIWLLLLLIRRGTGKDKGAGVADPNVDEIARLMRDVKNQDLVVEMDGKTFNAAKELSSGQQHRLSFASIVLAKWLGQPTPDVSPALVEQPVAASPEAHLQESDWVPAETVPVQSPTPSIPAFITEPMPEVKPVSTSITDVVGGILTPTPTLAPPVFKSIAMQINDILQTKLAGTPFETRGIAVNDAPDRGVVVTVDGEKYAGVKDVPDEEVRNLIRSAVMDWEKQSKPSAK
jgi:hypothetical protein